MRSLPLALALAALIAAPLPVEAAKGKKGGKGAGKILTRFDKDKNGTIDGAEAEALKGAFTALMALDTDHDGKLTDSEIAAAKVGKGKGKKKKSQ